MKSNQDKTKEQLINELGEMGKRIAELETRRKLAEKVLRESETKYRSLFDTMMNGFAYCKILVDENNQPIDFVHLEVNDAWERLIGLKREDVIGKKATEAMPGIKETAPDLISTYGKVALTGKATALELYYQPLEIWLNISTYCPQRGYFGLFFENITERKLAEEKEKQLQQELNLASRLDTVGEMALGIAHEINNPLTGVIGFSQILMKKDIPDDIKKAVKSINEGGQRVAGIVSRLFTFGRYHKPQWDYVDINEIIETTLELRGYEMETANMKFTTQFAPDLPRTMADCSQLQQVFLNIIMNTETEMKLAYGGGSLLIKTETIDNTIRISFEDDGPGISSENLDKLFNPFFTTREVGEGTGLGLSLCYGIIAEHSGQIYAESKPNKGATFIVELPVISEPEQLELPEPSAKVSKTLSRAMILVR